ncbi:MAG: histidine kinase, partial [Lachnospiraceae bacterium]|nr:histidine kinase [Lachnospiraceae bacterium]
YDYIQTYIGSLNQQRFEENSRNYSVVLQRFRTFETAGTWMMMFVLVGNIFIIVQLTKTIISPLKQLAGFADQVSAGNFEIEIPPSESTDEIGIVTGAFQKMVVSIRQYIEKLRHSMAVEKELREKELLMETHLKDAKLKYLQAQINPHFLFNTLNAAAQLSMLEEADRTYDYLQNVADFFRYNVKSGDEDATLGQELELVDHYIYILNVRFSGEIHYEKQVEDSFLSLRMPGMILQPIVENCVCHGIREMEGDGKILLTVGKKNGRTYISVKDNGAGMTQEDIGKVLGGEWRTRENAKDSHGVGMDNVIARLRLYLGREDVMEIHSEGKNRGTEFLVYIQ